MSKEFYINQARLYIDNAFNELRRAISTYERNENTISENQKRLRNLINDPKIDLTDRIWGDMVYTLLEANIRITRINSQILREFDNLASLIAGYLKAMLDECMNNYSAGLKVQIRTRIQRLSDMRRIQIGDNERSIALPSATAMLSPYLIKTRLLENAGNYVTVRQAIRSLTEPTY